MKQICTLSRSLFWTRPTRRSFQYKLFFVIEKIRHSLRILMLQVKQQIVLIEIKQIHVLQEKCTINVAFLPIPYFLLCRIPPDVKSRVMCTGIRESRSDTWDKLFNRMASQTPSDQTIILSALGCSREHWVLER